MLINYTATPYARVFLCWALRSPVRKTFKNHNVYLLCVKGFFLGFFVACFFWTGTSTPFIILSPDFESKRVWAFFLWCLTLVKRGVWILPQLAPSLRASHRWFEWRAHQLGPHLRGAELRSGHGPNQSDVKPAWTDTLRHLVSSPHSWDGTLPTPCVKQSEPDSTASAYLPWESALDY